MYNASWSKELVEHRNYSVNYETKMLLFQGYCYEKQFKIDEKGKSWNKELTFWS